MGKTFTIEAEGTHDYPAIILATVRALKSLGGTGKNKEIAKRIIELEGTSEEEQSYPQSGDHRSRFNYALSWARTNLKINGNLDNTAHAVWALTESGFKIDSLEDAKNVFVLATQIEKENRSKSGKKQKLDTLDDNQAPSLPENRNFIINPDIRPYIPGMMLATIIAIKELGGSATNYEIIACVIKNEGISEEEQSYTAPQDPRPKLDYHLAWVRTYLKMSGDLESLGRGVWVLTESGFRIDTLQDAQEAFEKYNEKIKERQKERHTKNWKSVLLEILKKTDPNGFEELCKLILLKVGFIKVEITALPNVADGGVDGVGIWRENLLSRKIYFQCKRTKNSISVDGIRDFRGALDGRANQGLFITTSHFTQNAKDEAIRDGALLVDLIDGNKICDLLKKYELGFETDANGQKILTPEWFDKYNIKPKPKTKKRKK